MKPYEIYAIRYATVARRAHENFIGGDPHETSATMDYFVWLVRNDEHQFVVDTGFGLKCLVQLRPTRALMAGKFSSEHYIVGGIGILLSIICAAIINTILIAAEMPIKRSQRADARDKTPGIAQLESVPEQAHLSRAENGGEHRNWRPSRWQSS